MCNWEGCDNVSFHAHNGKFYCFAHWVMAMGQSATMEVKDADR